MFLPAYLIWALWLAVGYQELLKWVHWSGVALTQRWGTALLRGIMVGAVLLAVAWNWRFADLSDDWSTRTRGETILDLAEPNALILGWWDTVPVIEYLQLVEGQRPDVQAINRFLISYDDMRHLIQSELVRRPVYIDSPSDDLIETVQAEPAGPIFRLRPRK
jgi:hypothetical protein